MTMEATASADLIRQLQETRDTFLVGVSSVSESQAKFKTAPDRWSIEECAEHIALVENGLLARITQESIPSDRVERPQRQAELRKLGAERTTKRQAPERVRPTGRFGSMAKALEQQSRTASTRLRTLNRKLSDVPANSTTRMPSRRSSSANSPGGHMTVGRPSGAGIACR